MDRRRCRGRTARLQPKAIWRRMKHGVLPARGEKASDRDGRSAIKTLLRVSDQNDALGWMAAREHVEMIRKSARPLTAEQKTAIGKVLLGHLRDREVKRQMNRTAESEMNRTAESEHETEPNDELTGDSAGVHECH